VNQEKTTMAKKQQIKAAWFLETQAFDAII